MAVSKLMSCRGGPQTPTHSQPCRKGAEPCQQQNSAELCLWPRPSPPGPQGPHAVSVCPWEACFKPARERKGDARGGPIFPAPIMGAQTPSNGYDVWPSTPVPEPWKECINQTAQGSLQLRSSCSHVAPGFQVL